MEAMEDANQSKDPSNLEKNTSTIPLLQLIKQLLKNGCSSTLTKLQSLTGNGSELPGLNSMFNKEKSERSPSLNLLLRFQRLLICQIYPQSLEERSALGISFFTFLEFKILYFQKNFLKIYFYRSEYNWS